MSPCDHLIVGKIHVKYICQLNRSRTWYSWIFLIYSYSVSNNEHFDIWMSIFHFFRQWRPRAWSTWNFFSRAPPIKNDPSFDCIFYVDYDGIICFGVTDRNQKLIFGEIWIFNEIQNFDWNYWQQNQLYHENLREKCCRMMGHFL